MTSTFLTDYRGMQTEYGGISQYSTTSIDQMNSLCLLAYLATADRRIAEWCLTRALDEYVEGHRKFSEWADKADNATIYYYIEPVSKATPLALFVDERTVSIL